MALYIPVYIIKDIKWQTAQHVWLYYRLLHSFVHPFKNLGLRCQKTFRVKNKCISFSEIMGKVDNRVKQQIASRGRKATLCGPLIARCSVILLLPLYTMRFITSVLNSMGHRIFRHNVYYWLKAYDRGDNRIWCAGQAKPNVLQKSLIEGC